MKNRILIILLVIFIASSCTDLNVPNPYPSNLRDVPVNADIFALWHSTTQTHSFLALSMSNMADQTTSSWGTSSIARLSDEPRIEMTESTPGVNSLEAWNKFYATLGSANDILDLISQGATFRYDEGSVDTKMLEAWARFIQGISLGYLGLCFDQAVIVKEDTDPLYNALSGYADVINASVVSLDEAISLCNSNTFTLPIDFLGGIIVNNTKLAQMASSYAARLLVYGPRNRNENDNILWPRVHTYAENGIDFDLAPAMDLSSWTDTYKSQGSNRDGWVRVDHRIINLMDSAYPARWPADNVSWSTIDGLDPGKADTLDARLGTDFEYLSTNIFDGERGYYHFSHYRYKRYTPWAQSTLGPVPSFTYTENDLILAEAKIFTGDFSGAIGIINNGTRVNRGELDPLDGGATSQEILDAIFYERDVELVLTGMGISYFDMRRRNMLQTGTPLHFPVPFQQQPYLDLSDYSYGGVANADGINTSNGGWF
jgi:hypothetical protein